MSEPVSRNLSIPVVLFDGEKETDIGNLVLFPGMKHKHASTVLSRRIGISPRRFSIFFTDPRAILRRNILATNSNFSAMSRETGWVLLVMLNRSKRPDPIGPSRVVPTGTKPPQSNYSTRPRPMAAMGFDLLNEWERRMMMQQQMERETTLLNMRLGMFRLSHGRVGQNPGRVEDRVGDEEKKKGRMVCEECERGEYGFHLCINDRPIHDFRTSPFGPITRPVKDPTARLESQVE